MYKENLHACSLCRCGEELRLTGHQRQSETDVNKDGCIFWFFFFVLIYSLKRVKEKMDYLCLPAAFMSCVYLPIKHKAQTLFQSVSPKPSNELMFQNIFITSAAAFLANICCTRSENTQTPADSAVLSRYDSLHTSNKIIPFRLHYLKKKNVTTVITTVDMLLLKMKKLQKECWNHLIFNQLRQ